MRLDKFVSQATGLSRSQSRTAIRKGRVTVNAEPVTLPEQQIKANEIICLGNKPISLIADFYIALNKPQGFICSRQDEVHPSALNLLHDLPSHHRARLHFAGRLDVDTTGLCLITSDGHFSHRVTSPSHACDKVYLVKTSDEISPEQLALLVEGVHLKDEERAVRAVKVEPFNERHLKLTLREGKYHQVKRMIAAVGNHVSQLHRESVGNIDCQGLGPGQWRNLSQEEVNGFA